MSGNVPARAPDKRVKRTRDTLGDALMELIEEKPFDDITVQEVLDRAGVGRSTFYAHYRDKQDLFLSDVEDFFEMMSTLLTRRGADKRRLAPVAELLAHVADVRGFAEALAASGKAQDVRELGVGYFARSIEKRLVLAGVALSEAELRLAAVGLAGAMFSLLDWWMAAEKRGTPAEVDAMFHRMAWGGLGDSSQPKKENR